VDAHCSYALFSPILVITFAMLFCIIFAVCRIFVTE